MALPYYKPQTQVDWNSKEAYSQYRLWRKEVLRIVNGPLHDKDKGVKLNHVFKYKLDINKILQENICHEPVHMLYNVTNR